MRNSKAPVRHDAVRRACGRSIPWGPSVLAAAGALAALTAQGLAAPLCTPDLAITSAHLSEMRALQRIWTARIAVDASQCATTSGRFFIRFVRLKEVGPDLPFAEAFTWRPGVIEVSTTLAADEAVLDVSIGYVRPCACRAIGSR